MKSNADYEAIKARLNTQQIEREQQIIEREQQIRRQLETCPLDELLIKTGEMQEKANAKILEYGVMQKKTFSPLPELVHDTSLPIEAQKYQLIDQYIVGMNKVATVTVAINTKIKRDEAMTQYQAMKQVRAARAPQASSSTAGPACEETEEKKSGPGLK